MEGGILFGLKVLALTFVFLHGFKCTKDMSIWTPDLLACPEFGFGLL